MSCWLTIVVSQLERALDLYLAGDFPREILAERKARLEGSIAGLERERAGLVARIEAQTLSDEEIQTLRDFAATVGAGLERTDTDFAARRRLIELLDVRATLTVEDGKRIAYVRCMLGEEALSIAPNSP